MRRALFIIVLAMACSRYEPAPVDGAVVQLAFENRIENLGEADLEEAVLQQGATFRKGAAGRALFTRGNGGSVELNTLRPIRFFGGTAITFDFKRENWENPYKAGSGTQTLVVVTGRTPDRLEHIAFNASPSPSGNLYVRFNDAEGGKHSLSGGDGSASVGRWRNVSLRVDRGRNTTEFLINGKVVDTVEASPVLLEHGLSRIKLGTWFKKNQAYRGYLDNFVISDV